MTTTPPLALPLAELDRADVAVAGGKGASLGELIRAGVQVPPGFVVTTEAFRAAMAALDPAGRIPEQINQLDPGDAEGIATTTAQIRDRIRAAALPAAVQQATRRRYDELARSGSADVAPVAVRSSATSEDSAEASFAGLQDTYLWVRGAEAVIDHVRRCWASLYSVESVTYRRRRDLPDAGLAMAVVVQQMVDARCSGVMFTCSPTTGDRSVISLEAAWGLGSAVVSGEVTPDTYLVNKVTGDLLERRIATKGRQHRMDPSGTGVREDDVPTDLQDQPCLDGAELQELVGLGRRVEKHYGSVQDIEWAIARDVPAGQAIFLLQSRPETVWASRQATPAATPKARSFDHVIARLGGPAAVDLQEGR